MIKVTFGLADHQNELICNLWSFFSWGLADYSSSLNRCTPLSARLNPLLFEE